MAQPKYDYDGEAFYTEILALSMQGLNDREIADSLTLTEATFCNMKNGTYAVWSKEENERRSERIKQVLTRGRNKIVATIRGRYLAAALGRIVTKTVQKRYVEEVCECRGQDPSCEICGGLGKVVRSDKWITQESEIEMPPNMQALATLLFHWDSEWRKIQKSKGDEEINHENIKQGIDIEKWINGELSGAQTGNDDTNS